jgi:hypothetical protein
VCDASKLKREIQKLKASLKEKDSTHQDKDSLSKKVLALTNALKAEEQVSVCVCGVCWRLPLCFVPSPTGQGIG